MRALLAAILALPLTGCFAVFIPGSVVDKVAGRPTYCVAATAKVGDRINVNGAMLEVTNISGPAPYFCRDQPEARRIGAEAKAV